MKANIQGTLLIALLSCWMQLGGEAQGQWATQSLLLKPGWNAVFLEVQPVPDETTNVFAGVPVESVWRWSRRFRPVQYISNPSDLIPPDPDWLVYLPPGHPLEKRSNLYALDAGRAYLIKLAEDASETSLVVTGKVVLPRREWVSDSLNFVGFGLPTAGGASHELFFAGNPDLAGQPIYGLSEAGRWVEVDTSMPMPVGRAFWIRNGKASAFGGPVGVRLTQRSGLDYGEAMLEQTVELRNESSQALEVTVRPVESMSVPTPTEDAVAGPVALAYWHSDLAAGVVEWVPLEGSLQRLLGVGETWYLRLAVRRADMVPDSGTAGNGRAVFQSMLEVTDNLGLSRTVVPVTAVKRVASAGGGGSLTDGAADDAWWGAGLWVGTAVLRAVAEVHGARPDQPDPTASEFGFRLIVHRDRLGRVRLLQKVVQMWLKTEGRYLLIADDPTDPKYADTVGAAMRNGTLAGRRLSSAAFGFGDALDMERVGAGRWTVTVELGYDDALNPFKHLHHPDHDNLTRDFSELLGPGRESFTVRREIELEFTAEDPEHRALPGWGDSQLGGIYREKIYGLIVGPNDRPIVVEGIFRLSRASLVDVLNDEH